MNNNEGCEYAEWIDNDFICRITGTVCIYSIPNRDDCYSVYEKNNQRHQLKKEKQND